uniref:Uncharacterized protein n=1 Tax=Trichuris muris TaxID=70415 RepID=A0A5S6QCR7_TRIMR
MRAPNLPGSCGELRAASVAGPWDLAGREGLNALRRDQPGDRAGAEGDQRGRRASRRAKRRRGQFPPDNGSPPFGESTRNQRSTARSKAYCQRGVEACLRLRLR